MSIQRLGVRLLRRGPPRGLISLGLVGVGPVWEHRYRSAVRRLSHRLAIRAVHDPVSGRAQAAAHDSGAEVCTGLKQLLDHPALDGLLLLDASWYGVAPAFWACERQRPALIASHPATSPCEWQKLHETAQQQSVMLVPELAWRFQPSTVRLRELIASRLGPVRSLRVRLHPGQAQSEGHFRQSLAFAVDWCGFVSRQTLGCLTGSREPGAPQRFFLEFQSDIRGRRLNTAEICPSVMDAAEPVDTCGFQAEVDCERGVAFVHDSARISWNVAGEVRICEELGSERTEEEVILDQFCRRLVGGLIPTATMQDLAIAWNLVALT